MDCWICGWWKLLLAGKPRSYGYIYNSGYTVAITQVTRLQVGSYNSYNSYNSYIVTSVTWFILHGRGKKCDFGRDGSSLVEITRDWSSLLPKLPRANST
ncbi:MAG TPA: hypothetical protein VLT36_13390, partial [Candidatus Dormibacteraeota bacterium]|nr:hypothetical protein [Candidatus Dormibacteraeota bacterium]